MKVDPTVEMIEVFNTLGVRMIALGDIHKKKVEINTETWPAGWYVLRIASSDQQLTQSILIKE